MNNVRPADQNVVLPFTRAHTSENPPPRPLKLAHWLPPKIRNEVVAFLGELVGTFLFLFFAFAGTQVANMVGARDIDPVPSVGVLLYIALSFGFSLAVTVWVFFRISGGLFNPAVSVSRASFDMKLTFHVGKSRTCSNWSYRLAQVHCRCNRSNTRRHRSSWHRVESLPRRSRSPYNSQRVASDQHSAWTFHRDVMHCSVGLYHVGLNVHS